MLWLKLIHVSKRGPRSHVLIVHTVHVLVWFNVVRYGSILPKYFRITPLAFAFEATMTDMGNMQIHQEVMIKSQQKKSQQKRVHIIWNIIYARRLQVVFQSWVLARYSPHCPRYHTNACTNVLAFVQSYCQSFEIALYNFTPVSLLAQQINTTWEVNGSHQIKTLICGLLSSFSEE